MAVRGGHCPMADSLGDFDMLQRLLPCFLGSTPALALGLWDQSGLIKGGKATSRVTSARHQLHMQCLQATGTACVGPLHWLPAAPEVLSESNHFPVSSALNCPYFLNCSSLPPTPFSFPKMPAENFPCPSPHGASPQEAGDAVCGGTPASARQ